MDSSLFHNLFPSLSQTNPETLLVAMVMWLTSELELLPSWQLSLVETLSCDKSLSWSFFWKEINVFPIRKGRHFCKNAVEDGRKHNHIFAQLMPRHLLRLSSNVFTCLAQCQTFCSGYAKLLLSFVIYLAEVRTIMWKMILTQSFQN